MRAVIRRRKVQINGKLFFLWGETQLKDKVILIKNGEVTLIEPLLNFEISRELHFKSVTLEGFFEFRGKYKKFLAYKYCQEEMQRDSYNTTDKSLSLVS